MFRNYQTDSCPLKIDAKSERLGIIIHKVVDEARHGTIIGPVSHTKDKRFLAIQLYLNSQLVES